MKQCYFVIPSILLPLKKCYFEKVLLCDPVNTVNLEKKDTLKKGYFVILSILLLLIKYFEKVLLLDPVNTVNFTCTWLLQ